VDGSWALDDWLVGLVGKTREQITVGHRIGKWLMVYDLYIGVTLASSCVMTGAGLADSVYVCVLFCLCVCFIMVSQAVQVGSDAVWATALVLAVLATR
jgi:hypothetical protein